MDEREATGLDRLLRPFLLERDEDAAEGLLAQLITEHAAPVIEKTIRSKLHVSLKRFDGSHLNHFNQDALEISSDVRALLLNQLRSLKESPDRKTIYNFRSYAAVITHHACSEYLRQKHPARNRLKNRLRYLLTHQPAFALWEDEEQDWLCGLAEWRGQKSNSTSSERLRQLRDNPQVLTAQRPASSGDQSSMPSYGSLAAIFEYLCGPVELDGLVSAVAELYGLKDQTSYVEDEAVNACA